MSPVQRILGAPLLNTFHSSKLTRPTVLKRQLIISSIQLLPGVTHCLPTPTINPGLYEFLGKGQIQRNLPSACSQVSINVPVRQARRMVLFITFPRADIQLELSLYHIWNIRGQILPNF